MGIQGLLPFLKAIHTPVNISNFQGCTVAVDAYCWLHRGAFACAEKLALGEKTDQYVHYCMKYIEYMLRKNLRPILVFDGCHLKSKADVEKTRRERRELHKKKAAQFLREGKRSEAKECLQRCVDITPQMALELMNACRNRGVDCIVAPYEADAQLAYLNLRGIADIIVTEDSDLLLFGCDKHQDKKRFLEHVSQHQDKKRFLEHVSQHQDKKRFLEQIIFKMDFFGNGTLIEKSRLNEVMSIKGGFYTFEKFRHMCILSGCDYLPSIPGIGLAKACKVMKTARQPDLRQMLKKLPTYLKGNLTVTDEYIEGFIQAENTFLYQLVFDPITCKLCPLNPYPPELDGCNLDYAGEFMHEEKAWQISLGNIDIHNYKRIAYFDPQTFVPKNMERPKFRHQLSIWDKNFRVKSGSPCKEVQPPTGSSKEKSSLHGRERTIIVPSVRRNLTEKLRAGGNDISDRTTNEELMSLYEDDGENTNPDLEIASKHHLFKSGLGGICLSLDDLKDKKAGVSQNISPDTTLVASTESQQENINTNEGSGDEDDHSEDEEPKKCRKRKMPTSPSRPSAADIGEDAFRTATGSNKCMGTNSGDSFTPSKNRNVFAVHTSDTKMAKFDLDAPAICVKSRYFHSDNTPGHATNTPGHTANSTGHATNKQACFDRKSLSKSPHKVNTTLSTSVKDINTKMQKTIVLMFENISKCPQQNRDDESDTKQQTSKYIYMHPQNSQLQSNKDSSQICTQKCSNQEKDLKEEEGTKLCQQPKLSRLKKLQAVSGLDKFQSSFLPSNKKQDLSKRSAGSVFDWSNSKSGLKMTSLQSAAVPLTPDRCQLGSVPVGNQTNLKGNSLKNDNVIKNQTAPEGISRINENNNQDNLGNNTRQSIKIYPPNSSLSDQDQQKQSMSTNLRTPSSVAGGVVCGLVTESQYDEVTELQSCSYDEFLNSLGTDRQSCQADVTSDTPVRDADVETMSDSLGESVSQVLQGDSQVTDDGSSTALNVGESGGPTDTLSSLDSGCYSIKEDFIDLTDAETDSSQVSCISSVSSASSTPKPSNQNVLRKDKCRVSGLSRSKSSSSVKKSTQVLLGQRSIKDLISKFQYKS